MSELRDRLAKCLWEIDHPILENERVAEWDNSHDKEFYYLRADAVLDELGWEHAPTLTLGYSEPHEATRSEVKAFLESAERIIGNGTFKLIQVGDLP